MSEIKPPSAKVLDLKGKDYKQHPNKDVESVRSDLMKLANDIEQIADKTKWPEWCRLQANSMREFCKHLMNQS